MLDNEEDGFPQDFPEDVVMEEPGLVAPVPEEEAPVHVFTDVDPEADKEDAAEARAKRTGGRDVRVTTDRRTTTISAE